MGETIDKEITDNVILCFFLNQVSLENGSELPSMFYSATLDDSTIDAFDSVLATNGTQRWLNNQKIIWNMPRSCFDEYVTSKAVIEVTVKWSSGEDVAAHFSIPLPPIEETIHWDQLYETVVNEYHFQFHLHAQPNYAPVGEYYQSSVGDVLYLTSQEWKSSPGDYELDVSIESIQNWKTLEAYLTQHHDCCNSDSYNLRVSFNQLYQTYISSHSSAPLLSLNPLRFHCPIGLLSLYLYHLNPITIELCKKDGDGDNVVVCEFASDFERLGLNVACCPSDSCFYDGVVHLNDTVELPDLLDYSGECPMIADSMTNDQITMKIHYAIRKVETSKTDNAQIHILKMKLKNLEDFQKETMNHYEKELEMKQKTIYKLTQANREFEKLCLTNVCAYDAVALQNENELLKAKNRELENAIAILKKEKDEMREVMVRMCTD